MNLIAKKIRWIGILLLVGFSAAAAALYFDLPAKAPRSKPAVVSGQFVCPMHSDVVSAKAASTVGREIPVAVFTVHDEAKVIGRGAKGRTEVFRGGPFLRTAILNGVKKVEVAETAMPVR